MPRPKRSDKFFYQTLKKRGSNKGLIFFGRNYLHKGEATLQELLDFMKQKGIDPAKVKLDPVLLLWAKSDG